jgi:uncharacterized protein (TIGR03067 family)
MKMHVAGVTVLLALVGLLGCSRPAPKPDAAKLQAAWKGRDGPGQNAGQASLIITDTNVEFHGANPAEWYKATYTLHEDTNPKQLVAVITECPFPQYVGKTANAIYKLDGNTLTIGSLDPGNPKSPTSFTDAGMRTITFTRQ